MHAQYNDRVFQWNRDFEEDDRVKILVLGDSFGRDFANILSELSMADQLQISYVNVNEQQMQKYESRISEADFLFYAVSGAFDSLPQWLTEPASHDRIYVVGVKNYGSSNGWVYSHRFTDGYLNTAVSIDEQYWIRNDKQKEQYGERYVDMLLPVMNETGNIRVFTDDGKFISQDCRHLTQSGAQFYASVLDFSWLMVID